VDRRDDEPMSGPSPGHPPAQHTTARDLMLTLLAVAAGCLDAVSFLGLGQVLVAAMTGNTVLLGIALGEADAQGALRAAISIAGFVAGAVLGAAIVDRDAQDTVWSPAVTWALALELVILVALALAWHLLEDRGDWSIDYRYPLIVAAGITMGLQSAAAHRIGVPGVATTYVTGTLTSLASRVVRWLRMPQDAGNSDQARKAGAPWLAPSVWIAYGAGAVFAGATHLLWPSGALLFLAREIRWPSAALLLPIGIIAVVALMAAIVYRRRPPPA
jgi:uncharacterized membrane protein YoaK (UPF0700 family)